MGTSPAGSVLLPTRLPSNRNLMLLVPIAVVVTWGGGFLRLLGSQDKAGWTSETSHNRLAGFTMGLALSWPRHVVSSVESGGGLRGWGGGGLCQNIHDMAGLGGSLSSSLHKCLLFCWVKWMVPWPATVTQSMGSCCPLSAQGPGSPPMPGPGPLQEG